jgi:hypothetical protein
MDGQTKIEKLSKKILTRALRAALKKLTKQIFVEITEGNSNAVEICKFREKQKYSFAKND